MIRNNLYEKIKKSCSKEKLEWYYREIKSMYFAEKFKENGFSDLFWKTSLKNVIWEKSLSLLDEYYSIIRELLNSDYFSTIKSEIKSNTDFNKLTKCKNCDLPILDISKKEKNEKKLEDFFCQCDNNKIFNIQYYTYKKNLIIYNYILSLSIWMEDFFEILNKLKTNYNDPKFIYKMRVLFEDAFMFNDTLITLIFYLNDNRVKAFSDIDGRYHKELNHDKIKETQNYKEFYKGELEYFSTNKEFIELLKSISILSSKNFNNKYRNFCNLTIFSKELKQAFSIFRNKNTHNFLIFHGSLREGEIILKLEDYLYKTCLLLIDKFLFFIFFLSITSN